MTITKNDNNTKWLVATFGMYLTNASAIADKDKVLAKEVLLDSTDLVDDWIEISENDATAIREAKGIMTAVQMPEEVNTALQLVTTQINSMDLTDEQSLQFKALYPTWESFIGKSLSTGYKVQYNDRLYRVRQNIATVLDNQYPSINTAALYEEINEVQSGGNAGTLEDPIPYNNNMQLYNGKYYSQDGVVYLCNRDSEQPVYQDLSALVGIYVELAN